MAGVEPPARRRVGVPYPADIQYSGVTLTVVRTCPICEAPIYDKIDPSGEIITNNYGEHCVQQHPHS